MARIYEDYRGAFCKVCRRSGKSLQQTGGVWVAKPFTNWKKAVEKMKDHEKSHFHAQANMAYFAVEGALREGSIMQQLQNVDKKERMKNRAAIKSLIRCTHFLALQHIAHTTNFDKLIDLVVACKVLHGENRKECDIYISTAVVEFVEVIGTWVEESTDSKSTILQHHGR